MRIMWQYDVDADLDLTDSDRTYFCYDERWRVIATYRDADSSPKERFVYHAAGMRGMGGSSYIDSVVLRDRDNTGGWAAASDGTLEERRYYVQNWRADVVAVTASDGDVQEYIRYSSYGVPTSFPKGDYDLDGDVDAADTTALNALRLASVGWNLDFNRDGNVDGDDDTAHAAYRTGYTGGTGGRGVQSRNGVMNRIGYAGYQWDPIIEAYHVRHRVYLPEIGSWSRRDPAEYVDLTLNMYQYATDSPTGATDPLGLITGECTGTVLPWARVNACNSPWKRGFHNYSWSNRSTLGGVGSSGTWELVESGRVTDSSLQTTVASVFSSTDQTISSASAATSVSGTLSCQGRRHGETPLWIQDDTPALLLSQITEYRRRFFGPLGRWVAIGDVGSAQTSWTERVREPCLGSDGSAPDTQFLKVHADFTISITFSLAPVTITVSVQTGGPISVGIALPVTLIDGADVSHREVIHQAFEWTCICTDKYGRPFAPTVDPR